jgi:hypothetical protein
MEGLNICISELSKEIFHPMDSILSFFSTLNYETHESLIFPMFSFLHHLSGLNDSYSEIVFTICLNYLNENVRNSLLILSILILFSPLSLESCVFGLLKSIPMKERI